MTYFSRRLFWRVATAHAADFSGGLQSFLVGGEQLAMTYVTINRIPSLVY